jgi:Putative DNA-binding domain
MSTITVCEPVTKPACFALEAAHQNALLQAVFHRADTVLGAQDELSPHGAAGLATKGLAAYRNNGRLNASRAMALMFPAVHMLLGEDDFDAVTKLHWLAHPPSRGDWSQYGADFGNWLAHENPGGVLNALPFLPDLARLDDALSRAQDAANASTELATLALLEQDPATVRVVLHPSVAELTLGYELTAFREALLQGVLPPTLPNPPSCAGAGDAFVVLARPQWRAVATPVRLFFKHMMLPSL